MIDRRQELGFALEAGQDLRVVRQAGEQDLDCDVAAELGVAGPIYAAPTAFAEQFADLVYSQPGPLIRGVSPDVG